MQFTKLKLSGFKSFVEHTELPIAAGLTAIVGPNGCGKSNLVEALRWVMGETSAKQMRGGGMDDVIFNGTSTRPPRNVADVHLILDNESRDAPALFNSDSTLEIRRRIERNGGSQYQVNGKETRARDVQLLFADMASGARSTALVSQGRIGAIIAAKPAQRRVLLEEAAGITGLHTRRHEAELRLKAAEGNLDRLEDVIRTMDVQFESLRRQARQANRYRGLSDQIRKVEAAILAIRWEQAIDELDALKTRLSAAEAEVNEKTAQAAAAARAQAEAASRLPELRQGEAAAAAALQRLITARDALDSEEKRVMAAQEDVGLRIAQLEADRSREQQRVREAETVIGDLLKERETLTQDQQSEAGAMETARADAAARQDEVTALEGRLSQLTAELAGLEASRNGLQRRLDELGNRQRALETRRESLRQQRQALESQALGEDVVATADQKVAALTGQLEEGRQALDGAEALRTARREALDQASQALRDAESTHGSLKTERDTLRRILESENPGDWPPVVDSLSVAPGYETALGAALGDDLTASTADAAPRHWMAQPALDDPPPLPDGVVPLSRHVTHGEILSRRLGQVGVLENGADGNRLAAALRPGQRLVALDGALWRWDGYRVKADAPTAAAIRLRQRNRIDELEQQMEKAQAIVDQARRDQEAAKQALDQATADEQARRGALRAAEQALHEARDRQAKLHRQATEQASRLAALNDSLEPLDGEINETARAREDTDREMRELADPAAGRAKVEGLRGELTGLRARLTEAQNRLAALGRDAENRRQRLEVNEKERAAWAERQETARQQIGRFDERVTATRAELDALQGRPAEIGRERQGLMDQLEGAEAARRQAADELAKGESLQREADGGQKAADQALAASREQRVRIESAVEQGKLACRTIAERVQERLDCGPDGARAAAELAEDAPLPDREQMDRRLERLVRERDGMGPVNLRAEQEATELESQIAALTTEREDLLKAIEKLRRAIQELNREGRERLLASFAEVDRHFQSLFSRLFGGGDAHLQLTETEDPLAAGLEILASPPGKRRQVLSLLSGGEQALTALALLFAVFMTNPAPICVLDEVDAPLDDANVDRFCSMLDEIAHSGATRFLLISHHRMTMARMDRLFGVTMTERGVSQLVSVDLKQAVTLRDDS